MSRPRQETLRELLGRVHERLRHAGSVDQESRKLLGTLTRDIERTLGAQPSTKLEQESLPRLEALAVRFEADHPALAQVLRQLIDALVKAGI
ncbi:MAG TPA: DUF4404 family protein [Steroidobacteraceae bacterium]|nr:DUF4404 family protein [Steroidobacteraceae bacterium]